MSTKVETKFESPVIIVANPGYSVLLTIGGMTIPVDAFTPINLSNMFSLDVINSSGALRDQLNSGFLKIHNEEEELPKDPNDALVKTLREAPTVKLAVPKGVKTSEIKVPKIDIPKEIQEIVDPQAMRQPTPPVDEDEDDEVSTTPIVGDSEPSASDFLGKPLTEKQLSKPVVTDVSQEQFEAFQNKEKE
jgi:hypothetical protein